MISEIRKSISATLHERTTSPLFGAFFFSWVLWNWKIVMVIFFTEASELNMPKFQYIDENLLNVWCGLVFPLISTIGILTLYAWLSEKAYNLWLWFDKRKNDIKNKIENQKLLSVEQSMKIRLMVAQQEKKYNTLLDEKDAEIVALKANISELQSNHQNMDGNEDKIANKPDEIKSNKEIEDFFQNEEVFNHFEKVCEYINRGWEFDDSVPNSIVTYLNAYDIIYKPSNTMVYALTEKGREYLKEYFIKKMERKKDLDSRFRKMLNYKSSTDSSQSSSQN